VGLWVKLLQALDWLACFDPERGSAPGALACKDAFDFVKRGQGFGIPGLRLLYVPEQAVIASPGNEA